MKIFRSILAGLFCLWSVIAPAPAMLMMNQLNGFNVASGASAASITFLQCSAEDPTNLTTYDFLTQNVGTASVDRYNVVAVLAMDTASAFTVSTITVGGNSATAIQNVNTAVVRYSGLFILSNPTGTSQTISVTMSEPVTSMRVCVWQVNNIASGTAVDSTNNDGAVATVSINVSALGVALAACVTQNITATNTWVGLTERADSNATEQTVTAADFLNDAAADSPLTITDTPSTSSVNCSSASFL